MRLCMAAQKGAFVTKYYEVVSPTAPGYPSVLPQGRRQIKLEDNKLKGENKRDACKKERNAVMFC